MRRAKLKIINRRKCKGWYIRPTERGVSRWIYLSESKVEAERLALDYEKQRWLKKVQGFNSQADTNLAIEQYLKYKFSTTLTTKGSRRRYEAVIRRFQNFLQSSMIEYISDITKDMVFEYLQKRGESIADKTWNIERALLVNLFKFCIDNEWADKNPVSRIPTKRLSDPKIEYLTQSEAEQLLVYLRDKPSKVPYYEIIATLLYTGMRVNEAAHLTKDDVMLDKGLMIVQEKVLNGEKWTPKTKQRRYVPIPNALRKIIEKQMESGNKLLFSNTVGTILKNRRILEKLQRACLEAGLKKVHAHSLRHTFTSISSEKGMAEPIIQEVLGHKTAGMTRRYRHLRPDFIAEQFKDFGYAEN